jgi:hypothetical protein
MAAGLHDVVRRHSVNRITSKLIEAFEYRAQLRECVEGAMSSLWDPDRSQILTSSRGRTIQTIGRAHAIKGFVADRPLARELIANPALAMKKIRDTTLHNIIAAMIPPPESGPCGPAASITMPKGPSRETKTT